MNEDFVLEGQLSDIFLPTVLMSLHNDRETGILEISEGSFKRELFVEEARIVHVSSTDPDDGLAECLLRRGLISLPRYLEVRESLGTAPPGRTVPAAFRAIEPDKLQEGAEGRLRDLILSVLRMKVGRYSLRLASFSTADMMILSADIPSLLFDLMQAMTCWGRIYGAVGDPDARLILADKLPPFVADLDMDTDQAHLMDLCRSGMPVSALVEASYMPPFQTYRLLWTFLTLGLVVHPGDSDRAKAGASIASLEERLEHYNDLFAYVHGQLEQVPDPDAVYGPLMASLSKAHPRMADGQDGLRQYGKIDVDLALWHLRKIPEEARERALNAFLHDVLEAFTSAAEAHLPSAASQDVAAYVRSRSIHPSGDQR